MKALKVATVGLLGSIALASGAAAADPLPVVNAASAPVQAAPSTLAGYVDVHFGRSWGQTDWQYLYFGEPDGLDRETFVAPVIGGAGRAAYEISPALAVQLDSWFNLFGRSETDWDYYEGQWFDNYVDEDTVGFGGVAAHLIFRSDSGLRIGLLGSAGGEPDEGLGVNVAGELGFSGSQFRTWLQGGYTIGLTSNLSELRAMYTHGAATFYVTPDVAVSGNIGWARISNIYYPDDPMTLLSYGGRLEAGLGSSPFTVFLAYQGSRTSASFEDGPYSGSMAGYTHTVAGGIRILLGRDTLQSLDDAVGFADLNPLYGDPFGAH